VLQLFKNNHFANALILLPLAIGLHVFLFFGSGDIRSETDGWLFRQLSGDGQIEPLWNGIISGVFVFFQAVFINRLAIIHRLNNEINILPGFLWLFWSAFHPDMMGLNGIHPALLFTLVGMNDLMRCFKKRRRALNVFNAGLFFSLASLFYFPLLVAIVFGLFMLFVFLSIRFPEPQQYLVGLGVPYFLALSYAYFSGSLESFFYLQWEVHEMWGLFSGIELEDPQWVILGLSVLLMMISVANIPFYHAKKEIFSQRKISMLFYYVLFSIIGVLSLSQFDLTYLLLLLWPLTIFISDSLYNLKNPVISELVIWLFIGISFFMQYEFLF